MIESLLEMWVRLVRIRGRVAMNAAADIGEVPPAGLAVERETRLRRLPQRKGRHPPAHKAEQSNHAEWNLSLFQEFAED
ncbi:hypothetical protein PoB_002647200 [Plakobranchus ocellatus]|uniref:Uncharacterized protein n=1 Tax=Plakobranchus ocellatus TaxID=259542 RepID=A0AAV3ZZG7_9GAST|nr:hypothetical protein PoB_002647200 [Plakobranchus ocellatus]